MIVCNKNTTLDELSGIKLERPERAGRFWEGIPHHELALAIHDEVKDRGWNITQEAFSLSKDKRDLAGAFELDIPDVQPPDGQRLSLGFLTSNNLRRSLRLLVGTRVLVCNNGCATGEILMKRKHTTQFDLFGELEMALDDYTQRAQEIPKVMEQLHTRNLTDRESNDLLMHAGRQGIMPWSRIGKVDTEFRRPSYSDHAERSSFGLLQAFTHICKRSPELKQMDQMNQFRELLPVPGQDVSLN